MFLTSHQHGHHTRHMVGSPPVCIATAAATTAVHSRRRNVYIGSTQSTTGEKTNGCRMMHAQHTRLNHGRMSAKVMSRAPPLPFPSSRRRDRSLQGRTLYLSTSIDNNPEHEQLLVIHIWRAARGGAHCCRLPPPPPPPRSLRRHVGTGVLRVRSMCVRACVRACAERVRASCARRVVRTRRLPHPHTATTTIRAHASERCLAHLHQVSLV